MRFCADGFAPDVVGMSAWSLKRDPPSIPQLNSQTGLGPRVWEIVGENAFVSPWAEAKPLQ